MGSPPASFNVDEFRVRGDGAENAGNWLAAANANVTINPATVPIFMVRWLITSLAGAGSQIPFEYNHNGAGFVALTTTSTHIQFKDSTNVTGDYNLTEQMGRNQLNWFNWTGAGTEDGQTGTSPTTAVDDYSEIEAVLGIVDAATSPGDTIIVRPGPTNITTHNQTLTITVGPLGSGGPSSGLLLMGCGD